MSVLENATKRIRKYVMIHYGNLLTTEEASFDETNKLWKAQLKSNYPRLIKNDYPEEERYIRVLPLRRLGTVCFNESFQLLKDFSIKRGDSIKLLRSYLSMWQDKAESIVVATSSKELADTSPARVFLNPVNKILDNFLQKEDVLITPEELGRGRIPTKLKRWLTLLEDLKLIEKKENGYSYGKMFTTLRKEANSDREFQILSMAYVLKESYPLLKEVFGIKQFEAIVHLDSCYYRPALEAEAKLYQKDETLFKRYLDDYGYRPLVDLRHNLHELHSSRALYRKNSYSYANDALFDEMLEIKETQLPVISFPHT
jgi:hypothetical protein